MTLKEADKAARLRVPVIVTGGTAFSIGGAIVFRRIQSVGREYDERGRVREVVTLIDSKSDRGFLNCPVDSIEIAPDCPEILKRLVSEAV